MTATKSYNLLFLAILCSIALVVFSLFIHFEFPLRLIAFAALLVPAFVFSTNPGAASPMRDMLLKQASAEKIILYGVSGTFTGLLFSVLHRWHINLDIFPGAFHFFAFVAALVGCTEELVFRGFIQDYARSINVPFSVFFSSISHTAYKCCLFLLPLANSDTNILYLAVWTFTGGLIIGSLRHMSGSLIPAFLAHGLFDILVYAEQINAPWWVW